MTIIQKCYGLLQMSTRSNFLGSCTLTLLSSHFGCYTFSNQSSDIYFQIVTTVRIVFVIEFISDLSF